MACNSRNSCNGLNSCSLKAQPDHSVGMDRRRAIMTKGHASKAALHHPDVLGAGAANRKAENLSPSKEFATIMHERKRGTLHSGSGAIVKSPAQAKAIAISELRARGE